jgi:hypothetical protein
MLSSRYFLLVLTGCYRNLENPYRHHLTLKKTETGGTDGEIDVS